MVHKKDGRYNTKAYRIVYDVFMLFGGVLFIALGVSILANLLDSLITRLYCGVLCLVGGSIMLYSSEGVWILE